MTAKVLMVDQLWLWILSDDSVITFATPEKNDETGIALQGDLRENIYKDLNGDYARQCEDVFDFAAICVYHAITALLDHTRDLNLQIFRIFEEYISELTGQQNRSFKEFRDNPPDQRRRAGFYQTTKLCG